MSRLWKKIKRNLKKNKKKTRTIKAETCFKGADLYEKYDDDIIFLGILLSLDLQTVFFASSFARILAVWFVERAANVSGKQLDFTGCVLKTTNFSFPKLGTI